MMCKYLKNCCFKKVLKNNIFSFFIHSEKESKKYVYHPINAFHLLQRTAIWIPRLTKIIPEFEFKFNLPKISDAYVGAALGLADIHEHYNINTMDLADGKIKDYSSSGSKFYQSNSPLTSMELIKISDEAKNVLHMDGAVNWLSAALEKAREEEQDSKFCSSIKYVQQFLGTML